MRQGNTLPPLSGWLEVDEKVASPKCGSSLSSQRKKMGKKNTKCCELGGKICIFNLGDCPFEGYLSASHYSSTT